MEIGYGETEKREGKNKHKTTTTNKKGEEFVRVGK
jgi:hypothetical protein